MVRVRTISLRDAIGFQRGFRFLDNRCKGDINPFRTAVPFWGQTTQILSSLSPKRGCGSKGVKVEHRTYFWVALDHLLPKHAFFGVESLSVLEKSSAEKRPH